MQNRKFNLKPFKHSRKDYVYHKSFNRFGALPTFAPSLLFVTDILNQDAQDCTAFASCAVRQAMKSHVYDPKQFWADECAYDGAPITQDGTSLRTPMNVGVETGWVIEQQGSPTGTTPQYVDKASAYFTVVPNNGMDMFDSMRDAIRNSNAPLVAGVIWYQEWDLPNGQNGGIMPEQYANVLGGHCIKIAGWDTIGGVPYLVIQNSWGTQMGNGGLFYCSRALANKIFDQGVFIWTDSPSPTVQKLGLLAALLQNLLNLLSRVGRAIGHAIGIKK